MVKKETYSLVTRPGKAFKYISIIAYFFHLCYFRPAKKPEKPIHFEREKEKFSNLNDFKTPQKKIESIRQTSSQESKEHFSKTVSATRNQQSPTLFRSDMKQKIKGLTEGVFSLDFVQNNTIIDSLEGTNIGLTEKFTVFFNFSSLENAFDFFSQSIKLLQKYHERVTYSYSINSKLLMPPPSFGIFLKHVKFLEMQLQISLLNLEKVLKTFLNHFVPEVEESVYDIEQSSVRSYYQIPELSSVDREKREKSSILHKEGL